MNVLTAANCRDKEKPYMNASEKTKSPAPAGNDAKPTGTKPPTGARARAARQTAPAGVRARSTKPTSPKAPTVRPGSKTAKVLALLQRPEGASLSQLQKATGWQAHSVRGFLSGALKKKMGLRVDSTKLQDGQRTYRVVSK
jgi:Protein of unknown function (DUF3489)